MPDVLIDSVIKTTMSLLLLLFLCVEVLSVPWTPAPSQCELIVMPSCQDLGYNWTVMPNLMGNTNQKEAEEAMAEYAPLLGSPCSAHARFFLCSAFAPLCSEHVSGAVGGCRGLCERVAASCGQALAALPPRARALLDCARFPDLADRRLCMRPPNASEPTTQPPLNHRWPFDEDQDLDVLRGGTCANGYARSPAGECHPVCGREVLYTSEEKQRAEAWAAALSWLALISTSFAVLTFCADPSRFRYPERPVVFLATCHAAAALAQLARGWLGARAVSCAGRTLAADGLDSPACAAFFTITYYLILAADAWFLNACVAWYLTAASEWSTEALERASAYFHAAAWGWAGAWTAAALALRRVSADELTGTCGVADSASAALVGVPRGSLLIAAAFLGAGAWPGVRRVRRALDVRGAKRVGRLAARSATAGALYLVTSAAGTAAKVWTSRLHEKGTYEHTLVTVIAWLSPGVVAGAWAWSHKSARVWRRAVCPPHKPCCRAPPPPLLRAPHIVSPYAYCKRPDVSRV